MHYQRQYFRDNREVMLKKLKARRANMTPEQKERERAEKRVLNFARTHGLSKPQAVEVLASQSEVCDICRLPSDKICFDHDHATTRHRGWLCDHCNRGLGQFRDNPEIMRRAIAYLETP